MTVSPSDIQRMLVHGEIVEDSRANGHFEYYFTNKRILCKESKNNVYTSILYRHIQSVSIRLRSRGTTNAMLEITMVGGNVDSFSFSNDADAISTKRIILEKAMQP